MTKHRGKRGDFWSKVDSSQGESECWLWMGSMGSGGYGQVRVSKRLLRTHRVAWELTNGSIPDGKVVCHRCDNPRCCNPHHLFLGSQQENVADMISKGRNASTIEIIKNSTHARAKGEQNSQAKLTEDEVIRIRRRWTQGGITKKELASQFGVSDVLIFKIVRRQIWKHLEV